MVINYLREIENLQINSIDGAKLSAKGTKGADNSWNFGENICGLTRNRRYFAVMVINYLREIENLQINSIDGAKLSAKGTKGADNSWNFGENICGLTRNRRYFAVMVINYLREIENLQINSIDGAKLSAKGTKGADNSWNFGENICGLTRNRRYFAVMVINYLRGIENLQINSIDGAKLSAKGTKGADISRGFA